MLVHKYIFPNSVHLECRSNDTAVAMNAHSIHSLVSKYYLFFNKRNKDSLEK